MSPSEYILDAARPIAAALAAIGDLRVNVPSSDVLISYTYSGCIVRVAERRAAHWDVVEAEFQRAFLAAGWGVTVRQTGGLALEHPVLLTRT
ncbi:hypothetical protein [Streptomyces bacillaris]|uniref:hypothetical protein n=1 Tax=Streptomyces bacillaris TaxID=68179 RepID=UPI00345F65B9